MAQINNNDWRDNFRKLWRANPYNSIGIEKFFTKLLIQAEEKEREFLLNMIKLRIVFLKESGCPDNEWQALQDLQNFIKGRR